MISKRTLAPANTQRIEPKPVIMVEGILIFADPVLRKLMDVKIFVDTDADIRFIRRLERDIHERGRTTEMVVHQYLSHCPPDAPGFRRTVQALRRRDRSGRGLEHRSNGDGRSPA